MPFLIASQEKRISLKWTGTVLLFLVVLGCRPANAGILPDTTLSDPETVIRLSIERSGGEAWHAIRSLVTTSTLTVGSSDNAISGSIVARQLFPGYLFTRATIGTPMGIFEQIQMISPDSSWMESTISDRMPIPPNPFRTLLSASPTVNLAGISGVDFSLTREKTDSGLVYIVVAKVGENSERLEFDANTLLLTERTSESSQGPLVTRFSDFRTVVVAGGEVLIPFKQRQMVAGVEQTVQITAIEVNSPLTKEDFGLDANGSKD